MQNATDPWDQISRNKGYSPAYLAMVKAERLRRGKEALAVQERNATIARLKRRGAPFWVIKTLLDAAEAHDVSPADLIEDVRIVQVVRARNALLYQIKEAKPSLSSPRIAGWFGRDHTTILYAIASHADTHGLPKLVGYNIARSRQKNRDEQARRREQAAAR